MRVAAVPSRARRRSAFTLLEVVLAIVIAVGMMVVVLFFYQQAADLRAQLIQETERLSVARLLMERITSEIRTTRGHSFFQGAFIGESSFIQFIKTDFPSRAAWKGGALGRVVSAETDLKLVSYYLSSTDGTNVVGLERSEETLIESNEPAAASSEASANPKTKAASRPFADTIRFARFRYWDGKSWKDSWSGSELPQGIEVSLGLDPLPAGTEPGEYPSELFRRVIRLPESPLQGKAAAAASLPKEVSLAGVKQ